jgi:hypothetical protein
MSQVITISADELQELQDKLTMSSAIIEQYQTLTRVVLKEERQYAMEHGAADVAERLEPGRLNQQIALAMRKANATAAMA